VKFIKYCAQRCGEEISNQIEEGEEEKDNKQARE
jgi:hypothetical protein